MRHIPGMAVFFNLDPQSPLNFEPYDPSTLPRPPSTWRAGSPSRPAASILPTTKPIAGRSRAVRPKLVGCVSYFPAASVDS